MNMIERVARALLHVELSWDSDEEPDPYLLDARWRADQELYECAARAAIEAMRSPSHEMMLSAGWLTPAREVDDAGNICAWYHEQIDADDAWEAMIDAALKDS